MSEAEPRGIDRPGLLLLGILAVGGGLFFTSMFIRGLGEQSPTTVLASFGALVLIGATVLATYRVPAGNQRGPEDD